ncbi:MAG: hypothetical protein ABEI57_00645 [Halapricum sp.]
MRDTLRKGVFLFAAIALVAGMTMPAIAASSINYGADAAPNLQVEGDVTIADHRMGDSPLTYNNDNGDWVQLPGEVNESADNPISFVASDIAAQDFGAFPHAKSNTSALEAGEWSGTATVSNVETAPGVDAVELGLSAGNYSAFSNFSVTSDEQKRYFQTVLDVSSIDAGTTVEFRIVDANGDYYTAEINTSRSSGEDYIANATGEGYVYQRQLGKMTLTTAGDGTFNDIEKINVTASGGAANVDIAALNVEKMSTWDFGDHRENTDDDSQLETTQILEVKTAGAVSVADLSTLGDTFKDAHIKGLTVDFVTPVSALPSGDTSVEFSDASQYPGYDKHFKGDYRFHLQSAYDLSYSNLVLTDTVSVPGSAYVHVKYAEATGDTAFSDISSWTTVTGRYDSMGAEVTIDDTLQPGTNIVVRYDYLLTSDQVSALQTATGAMGPTGGSGGGILSFFGTIPGMLVGAVGGFIGVRWLRNILG